MPLRSLGGATTAARPRIRDINSHVNHEQCVFHNNTVWGGTVIGVAVNALCGEIARQRVDVNW